MNGSDPTHGPVARGAIAGLLAATALIAWFLLIDAVAGQPLETPSFLAGVVFGREPAEVGVGLLAFYTILHYAAFLMIGIAVSWALSRVPAAPNALLGLVLGFLLFDLMFYAGVVVTGVNVVRALGWPEVLAGNLIAGIALTSWLRRRGPAPERGWREAFEEHRIVREGVVAGLIGALAVAVWFLIFDAVLRQPLYTPAALGSALFLGATDPEAVRIAAVPIIGYTVLHFSAFLGVGLIASALAVEAEREPPVLLAFVLIFVTLIALFIGLVAIAAAWILGALGWWTVAFGTLIAAIGMGAYLIHAHPHLRAELGKRSLEEPV